MTLIKKDLVNGLIEKVHFKPRGKRKGRQQFLFPELDYTPLSRKRATELVNTTLEIVKRALERGEDVRIHGFGTFQSRFKWARSGRHPRTGQPIVLSSRRSISFRAFSRLRRRLNPPGAASPSSGEPGPEPVAPPRQENTGRPLD